MLTADDVRSTGQSLWLDNLDRGLLLTGGLSALMRDRAVTGLTSNPSIFEKALSGPYYEAPMRELASIKGSPEEIFETLAAEDIQRAADLLRPVYDAAGGQDGFVSLEVSPELARDAAATLHDGIRLAGRIGRPNLMIKVPATPEGLKAGEDLLRGGISVNFTLIFSVERYREVTRAYISAMLWRLKNGLPAEGISSVASFFVSRIDTAVDKLLDAAGKPGALALRGRTGVANSLAAYRLYLETFHGEDFKASGLAPQRILWASTSVKDPSLRPSLYMEELALPGSVNTAPAEALEAYFSDGRLNREPLVARFAEADEHFAALDALGVDFQSVLRALEEDGIQKFSKSYDGLLARIKAAMAPEAEPQARPGAAAAARLDAADFCARLWARDGSPWTADPAARKRLAGALGWLDLPARTASKIKDIEKFAAAVKEAGFGNAVLLAEGDRALAAEALRGALQRQDWPRLTVLDTVDPSWAEQAVARADLKRTLFICSGDGAGTAASAQFKHFWSLVKKAGLKDPGHNFAAITTPGSPLEKLAAAKKFRKVFTDPAGCGGFTALSFAGLVPAAVCGADPRRLLEGAMDMAARCKEKRAADNPGALLGALIGEAALEGRDKLTINLPRQLAAFGPWLEHTIAVCTGKAGRGVLPVTGEPLMEPDKYQEDRFFVNLRLGAGEKTADTALAAIAAAGHPVHTENLADACDLGAQFFLWQVAAAAAAAMLGVDPFDKPDGSCPPPETQPHRHKPDFSADRVDVYASPALKAGRQLAGYDDLFWAVFSALKEKEYLAISAYLPGDPKVEEALAGLRATLTAYTSSACALALGRRGARSACRLHAEGPDGGVFLILTGEVKKDILVPGEKYTFWQLETAQAAGEYEVLSSRGRRVLRLHLKHPLDRSLAYISERMARVGRTGSDDGPAKPEESEMLKLAVKKNNKTANTTTAKTTKLVKTDEYVVVDYPKNLETITSRHYSVRIGSSDCTGVDISVNDQPWQPCRHAVGYWWFDWNNFQPGTHQLVARMHKRNGEYLISKRRRCKVA